MSVLVQSLSLKGRVWCPPLRVSVPVPDYPQPEHPEGWTPNISLASSCFSGAAIISAPIRFFRMMSIWPVTFLLPLLSFAATNQGDEVVIVYNSRMPESKSVANYYAGKRMVPPNHVFGFALTTNEDISRVEFRDELQRPLSKSLEKEKLWNIGLAHVPNGTNRGLQTVFKVLSSKIRYAVLCYGVPLRIAEDPTIKEERPEKLRPEQREINRNGAAVDSELALLPLIDVKMNLGGPLRNWAYGATNADMLHPTNGILIVTRLD